MLCRWCVCGVSQSSVLGTLLFSIYVNDMLPWWCERNFLLYEGCPLLQQIYAWHYIVLYSHYSTVQKHNNKERSKTMRNLMMPCINLSEYWTSMSFTVEEPHAAVMDKTNDNLATTNPWLMLWELSPVNPDKTKLMVFGSPEMICKPLNFKAFFPGQGTFTCGLH